MRNNETKWPIDVMISPNNWNCVPGDFGFFRLSQCGGTIAHRKAECETENDGYAQQLSNVVNSIQCFLFFTIAQDLYSDYIYIYVSERSENIIAIYSEHLLKHFTSYEY